MAPSRVDVSFLLTVGEMIRGMAHSDRIRNLVLARSADCLDLATTCLVLADPCPAILARDDVEWDFGGMRDSVDEIEAQTYALLRYAGLSWDAIATSLGVSRQTLHRRMAKRSDEVLAAAQRRPESYEESLRYHMGILADFNRHIQREMYRELDRSPQVWQERRNRRGWWWE